MTVAVGVEEAPEKARFPDPHASKLARFSNVLNDCRTGFIDVLSKSHRCEKRKVRSACKLLRDSLGPNENNATKTSRT